jgi:hypothetical protein
MEAAKNVQSNHIPTTQAITDHLQKLTKQSPDSMWLSQKLTEAETAGLIEKTL